MKKNGQNKIKYRKKYTKCHGEQQNKKKISNDTVLQRCIFRLSLSFTKHKLIVLLCRLLPVHHTLFQQGWGTMTRNSSGHLWPITDFPKFQHKQMSYLSA